MARNVDLLEGSIVGSSHQPGAADYGDLADPDGL